MDKDEIEKRLIEAKASKLIEALASAEAHEIIKTAWTEAGSGDDMSAVFSKRIRADLEALPVGSNGPVVEIG